VSARRPNAVAGHEREPAKRQHDCRAGTAGADRGGAPVEALVDGAHDRRVAGSRLGRGAGLGVDGLGEGRGGDERPGGEARHNQAGKSVGVVSGHAAQTARPRSTAGRRAVYFVHLPGVGSDGYAPIPLYGVDLLLLGPVEARLDGRLIALGAPKQRAVLAMLALHLGRTVSTDRLAGGLWGEHPPPSAPKMVQLYVSHLRRLLEGNGAEIVTRGRGYELRLSDGHVDALRFEHLLDDSRAREALALWRGEALADIADEPFAAPEIRRLEELRLRAVEMAIDGDLESGRHDEVIGELEALIDEHPLRERLHAQRMLALYRTGRQAEALEAYRDARAVLVEQIGVEPGGELRRLHDAVLAQDPALDLPMTPPTQATGARPPPARPPPRRRAVPVLAAAALLLLAGVAAFGVSRLTQPDSLPGIGENEVGLIDPDGNRITESYGVGRGPGAVVAGGGSIWVANTLEGTVTRIDRESDQSVTIPVRGAPVALAFGAGSLWVADGEARSVAQVDPGTNTVEQRIDVGNAPSAVAFAGGALWVASGVDGTLHRIEVGRARHTRAIPLDSNPTAMASGAGALWVASEEAGTVSRIEPRSGTAVETIPVGNGPSAIATGEDAVWVVSRYSGTLSRIDPATNAVSWTFHVGDDPTAVAAGAGAVWVAGGEDGTVARVDPAAPRVRETIQARSSPAAIATAGGDVWTAAVAPQAAHRGGTLRVLLPGITSRVVPIDWIDLRGYYWPTAQVTSLLYDTLVAYRRAGGVAGATLVPALATRVPKPSRDGKTYVFTLRRGLRYSDGRPVRPDDFRASIERFLRITGEHRPQYYAGIVGARQCARHPANCDLSAGIETDPRARTITVHLLRRDTEFLHKLTCPFAFVVPSDTPVRLTGDEAPPGTGPYRVATWAANRGGRLVRNPYFGSSGPRARPAGFADRIEVSTRRDDTGRALEEQVADVQRGAADLAVVANPFGTHFGPDRLARLAARSPGQIHSAPAGATDWMFLNVRRRPFDDARVRRALNYATDRDRLVAIAGGREFARPTCQILPSGFPGYEPYCPYTAQPAPRRGWSAPDVDRARRLVAQSGTKGARIVVWGPDFQRRAARYFVGLLDDLGFRASLRILPTNEYFPTVMTLRSRRQIGLQGWALDYVSASSFIQPHFVCTSLAERDRLNASHSCDRTLVTAAARAAAAQGADAAAAWAATDRRIVKLAPAVPMTNRRAVVFVSKRVDDVQYHAQWSTLLDQLWVR
jgi:ABC-type transport system substrate-binding protein/DNA-binding SARP family transcriptional activator